MSSNTNILVGFADLPLELVIRSLLRLRLKELLGVRLLNRFFDAVIQNNVSVQYAIRRMAAGLEDNPRNGMLIADKIRAIEQRERAWLYCEHQFLRTFSAPPNATTRNLDATSEGFYMLPSSHSPDTELKTINYLELPTPENQNVGWKSIETEDEVNEFIMSTGEIDLAAIITL